MHKEILTKKQTKLLTFIKQLCKDFYLAGGTAIALQLGHRRSVDFDLFSNKELSTDKLKKTIKTSEHSLEQILNESPDELTVIVNSVKLTFLYYPYKILPKVEFEKVIKMPTLLDLAAMKAFALGKRARWKDYVDLFFIIKGHHALEDIAERANKIFGRFFNEKLLLQQLCYFKDLSKEKIEYLKEEPSDDEIKNFLTRVAMKAF